MNPALRTILLVAVAGIVGFLIVSNYSSKVDGYEFDLERAKLKSEFIDRLSLARHLPDARTKDWKDEIRGTVRWYFDELAAIYNRHPDAKKRPSGIDQLKEDLDKGRIKKENWASYEEWYKLANQDFQDLKDGKYDPIFAGSDAGLHLDILDIAPALNPATHEKANKIEFAIWGAPHEVEKETSGNHTTTRVYVPITLKQMEWKLLDDKNHEYQMSGSAEPYQKIDDPERWVEDFPPDAYYGTWYIDAFPHEAVTAELTINIEGRGQAGSDVQANYKWEIPLKDEWKLREGETFKAETMEMPEDYFKDQQGGGKPAKTAKK